MQEPFITVTGHVGAPPRTRVLADGAIVTDFRIAATPRLQAKDGSWSDGETMWFGVSCWRALAENVAASISKGDKVVVSGRLKVSTWKTETGEVRSGLEIISPTVGFDLSRGKAVLEKNPPLTVHTDPGSPLDLETGEVFEPLEDDEVSLGEVVGAAA